MNKKICYICGEPFTENEWLNHHYFQHVIYGYGTIESMPVHEKCCPICHTEEDMSVKYEGTIISGTLKTKDLIEEFLNFLDINEHDKFIDVLDDWGLNPFDDPFLLIEEDDLPIFCDSLMDSLNAEENE